MERLPVEQKLRLDRTLLEEAGLDSMTTLERNLFLRYCYHVLELRVGVVIASRLMPSQLNEFERLIDGDLEFAEAVLDFFSKDWRTSESFVEVLERAMQRERVSIRTALCQAAALDWLEDACPEFREVVKSEFTDLKSDIELSAAEILEAVG